MGDECCKDEECCSEKECCEDSGCSEGDMVCGMLKIADDAWAELMREKMKKQFEKKMGAKMDKVAEVCVDASIAYWQHKMKGEAACADYKEKIKSAMMG